MKILRKVQDDFYKEFKRLETGTDLKSAVALYRNVGYIQSNYGQYTEWKAASVWKESFEIKIS